MPGNDWFIAIDKVRGMFETAGRGTVFAGPGRAVTPLPDALGGDQKQWGLLAAPAKGKEGFFALLEAKAHFLTLPVSIVEFMKESDRVSISEEMPETPGAVAETEEGDDHRAQMRIPGASDFLAMAGYDIGRATRIFVNYGKLATIYHEMTHAWLWVQPDAEIEKLSADGKREYENATGVQGNSLDPWSAFTEAAAAYVADRIFRWCRALCDLDVLIRDKPTDPEEVQEKLAWIVGDYNKVVRTYGVVPSGEKILRPELSDELRAVIDRTVLDLGPLTKQTFDDTPLAGLRAWVHP
jgi:hypothetical protein